MREDIELLFFKKKKITHEERVHQLAILVLEKDIVGPKVAVVEHIEALGVLLIALNSLGHHLGHQGLQFRGNSIEAQIISVIGKLSDNFGEILQVLLMNGVKGAL